MNIDNQIAQRFKCEKCHQTGASVKRIAATGTGISKIFDIQHNRFIAASCQNCGYTEFYNPDMLKNPSRVGTVLDVLFG